MHIKHSEFGLPSSEYYTKLTILVFCAADNTTTQEALVLRLVDTTLVLHL